MPDSVSIVNVMNPFPDEDDPPSDTHAKVSRRNVGPIGQLVIRNTGQTPAYNVRHWGDMCFREFPLTGPLSERGRNGQRMPTVLGPNIISTKNFGDVPELNEQQAKDLHEGRAALYIHGEILYTDSFGKERVTRYRLMHGKMTGRMGVTTDLTFCEEGNEAN